MSKLEILRFPDPRLRTKAKPVMTIDGTIRRLAEDMLETMYAAPGIGLAATQVNVHRRVIVVDVTEDRSDPLVLINPEVADKRGDETMDEGCLSVPGFYESVSRSEWVRVKALDLEGNPFELETDGLKAVCIQHEIDHLEGKLFVDYLSSLKRQRIRRKLEKDSPARSEEPSRLTHHEPVI